MGKNGVELKEEKIKNNKRSLMFNLWLCFLKEDFNI